VTLGEPDSPAGSGPDSPAGSGPGPLALIPCVGAVVHDDSGRLLLVRRANPPGAGLWSIPGGKVEPGEDDAAAVVREVAEETGLVVEAGHAVGRVERAAPGGGTFLITDLICRAVGGSLVAGDDASAAGWFGAEQLAGLPVVPGLIEALGEWQVLPR
jgi:8-oxo-dGTP diphosphatase